jgi:hypothetical protein
VILAMDEVLLHNDDLYFRFHILVNQELEKEKKSKGEKEAHVRVDQISWDKRVV